MLDKHGIVPDKLRDQFFLIDERVIGRMVELADLNKQDVVLEIGAGVGNLTREIARKAGKVISFEIDDRFKPVLAGLSRNVEVRWESAWDYVQLRGKWRKRKEYNKAVSSLPYSLCEPVLHNLTFLDYDKVILLVPVGFAYKIGENPVFGSFFEAVRKFEVDKSKFCPVPKTNSVVIDLVKLPDPVEKTNLHLFLRQYIYQHEEQKTKNSLREGLIKFVKLTSGGELTKNEAKKIIEDSGVDEELLESVPDGAEIYKQVTDRMGGVLG